MRILKKLKVRKNFFFEKKKQKTFVFQLTYASRPWPDNEEPAPE
jgi:hypothetical protein